MPPKQKQLEVTPEMVAQIEKVTGTTVEADNIVVFEAAALSTNPISQSGSFYDGARPTRSMLEGAADALNSGEESVPLHTLHQQGREIPVGRVFHASIYDEVDGSTTLRAQFYLSTSEKSLIEKINLAVLDEVSVGIKSEKALCSTCGFDYFSSEASFENLWSQTCDKEHTIGEDGCHLKLTGFDKWMEMSLVSRGASSKPKILSRVKQVMPAAAYEKLAASGKPVEAMILFTSTQMENKIMPKSKTKAELAAEAEAEALKVTEPAVAPVADTPDPNTAVLEDIQTQIAALTETVTALASTVSETPKVSKKATKLAAKLAEAETLIETLEAAAAVKAPTVVVGGVAASTITDVQGLGASASKPSAFKTKRR